MIFLTIPTVHIFSALATVRSVFIAFVLISIQPAIIYAQTGKSKKSKASSAVTILNFYGDNGYKHTSQPGAIKMIEELCKKNDWNVISAADPAILNNRKLRDITLIVFNNNCGNEGRILNDEQQAALQQYVQSGGAFVSIHCAGALWHEQGKFQQWYEELVGARMIAHPPVQNAIYRVENQHHCATQHLPAAWKMKDEIHTFAVNPRSHVEVLISVDEQSYAGEPKMGGDHPMVWCQESGRSRSFFSALGHTDEIYQDKAYRQMIEGGMKWALRLERQNYRTHKTMPPVLKKALIVDMDADKGLFVNDAGQLYQWENQADFPQAKYFIKQDKGRRYPCEGCPSLRKNVKEINGHNSIVFREQELINDNEDAFDHLTTGAGYTFFCVLAPFTQAGDLKDVNSFFGNLKNGGLYEGFWGGLTDSNHVWIGSRNGITFGRWDINNPRILSSSPLQSNLYYVIIGTMQPGTDTACLSLFINDPAQPVSVGYIRVNTKANASRMAIGQERDAIEHPGIESFDGAIARFLVYEGKLNAKELRAVTDHLIKMYSINRK